MSTEMTYQKLATLRRGHGRKLLISEIDEIRELLNCGLEQKQIAKMYRVSQSMICHINKERHWEWI